MERGSRLGEPVDSGIGRDEQETSPKKCDTALLSRSEAPV